MAHPLIYIPRAFNRISNGGKLELILKSIENDTKYQINEYLYFGTHPNCHVRLNEDNAAERHANIEKKGSQLFIRDLRSATGTYVNETQVIEAPLKPGDIIRINNREFELCYSETKKLSEFPLKSKNQNWNKVLESLTDVSETDFPVLLLGPSGTGKDILAQKIHACSGRANGPFISVNCSALTESLIESELFGHIKGSFTGAINDRKGAFEAARGGTLFLDEIGDLPLSLQSKILRALENQEIRPVGSDRTIKTNVRIITATHHNLKEKIQDGTFRLDLYYRINVVQVTPPTLFQRMEDFEDLLISFSKLYKVPFSILAIEKLKEYTWPGNIRELKNVVARASALFPKQRITEDKIDQILERQESKVEALDQVNVSKISIIKEVEKQMIIKRLRANFGNQRQTAIDLGIPKSTLHDRLKQYNINPKSFKVLELMS